MSSLDSHEHGWTGSRWDTCWGGGDQGEVATGGSGAWRGLVWAGLPSLDVAGDGLKRGDEVDPSGCQAVADGNGRGGDDGPFDQSSVPELFQTHGEHSRREAGHGRGDVSESFGATGQSEQDARRPSLADDFHDAAGVLAIGLVGEAPRRGRSGSPGS